MALDRYINLEIAKPLVIGVSMLIVIFTGFTAAIKLRDAASGLISLDTVARLIGLNTIISLEVLLPTALYLSIIATLSRFYRDSEMSAMRAAGIGEFRILRSLSYISLVVALIVGIVSIFGRPWAYRESYRLEAEAVAEFDIRKIEPGRFIVLRNSKYILFARDVDKETGKLSEVFLQSERGDNIQVIFAREAYLPPVAFGEARHFELTDGYGYLLDVHGSRDRTLKYKEMTIQIPVAQTDTSYRRKAEPTHILRESSAPKDIAEFQWRTSTPLATLMLAILAVPLSRSAPRQGRHNNFLIAILVYVGLFNLISVARNQVEEGNIPAFPGLWWVYLLPALLFAGLMLWPAWQRRRH